MKHKHFKKHNIIIDLTSMLDVIFIILMVVMCNQHKGGEAPDRVSVDPVIPPSLEERVSTATISIPYEEDVVTRHIEMVFNNSSVPRSIEINKDNAAIEGEDNPYALFEQEMISFATDNKAEDIPVVLTLDDRDMLYRDAVKISEILSELDDEFDNLYCRGLTND